MKDNQILLACESVSTPLESQTSPPHRILVVEDDSSIRSFDTEALTASGYAVDAAEDGDAGWAALQANDYDLLITDNNMPKLSGVELLLKLRSARMDLLTIMATGTLPTEEFARYPWLQPAATLLKPYTLAELLQTVKEVLRETNQPVASVAMVASRKLKDNEPAPAACLQPRLPNAAHRILVVDEDRDLRQMCTEVLAGPGYQVDGVADGEAGWDSLQANQYELLITEHELPKLTGVDLIMKARAAHMALPIVMIADRLLSPELVRDQALSLAATLMKPFAVDALLDTVKNVLSTTENARGQSAPMSSWRSQPAAASLRL